MKGLGIGSGLEMEMELIRVQPPMQSGLLELERGGRGRWKSM